MNFSSFDEFKSFCANFNYAQKPKPQKNIPVWIFGAGNFGRDVANILISEGFMVNGFIETRPKLNVVMGLPVVSWEILTPDDFLAQIVIGIFNRGMPLDELRKITEDHGFKAIYMPWDIYEEFAEKLGWRFWLSQRDVILNSLDEIENCYDSLADETSKQCLLNVLSFRLGFNLGYASFRHTEPQYFNRLTLPVLKDKQVVYVDCGAYNGDTLVEITRELSIKQAWLFEPDLHNFAALVATVKQLSLDTFCIPCGVSDKHEVLSFMGNGEGAAICSEGSQNIVTVALDHVLTNQSIHFLKLDVEGAETNALRGAKELVMRNRPIIALSLYHLPKDPWEILGELQKICHDYKYYIRQHQFNSFDNVMYAIPNV